MNNPGHYDEYPELTRADEERERNRKAKEPDMNITTTKIAGEAMTDEQISALAKQHYSFCEEWCIDLQGFARALLASRPAAIGALERSEIFRSNLQRTREQWEKCDPDAMSKMSQAAVFHAINDAKRDVLMMHALLTTPTAPAQSCGEDAANGAIGEREALEVAYKAYCGKSHAHDTEQHESMAFDFEAGWQAHRATLAADEQRYTQADMERYGKCYADARDKRRAALTAEKVAAEPVAWMTKSDGYVFYGYNKPDRVEEELIPLYAAPQQPAQSAEQDEPCTNCGMSVDPKCACERGRKRAASTQSTATQPVQTQVALTVEDLADELENMLFDLKNGHDVDSSEYARLIIARLNAAQPTSGGTRADQA